MELFLDKLCHDLWPFALYPFSIIGVEDTAADDGLGDFVEVLWYGYVVLKGSMQ